MNLLKSILSKMILWAGAIGSLGLSIYCFVIVFSTDVESESDLYITFGTLLLIASIVFLQFACVSIYNEMNDTVKTATNKNGIGLDQIFAAFKDLETCLGRPWRGKINPLKKDVILFGPNSEGEYIYIHTFGKGRISIAQNNQPGYIIPPKEEEWRLEAADAPDIPDRLDDIIRYQFVSAFILPELTRRMQDFLDGGPADLSPMGIDQSEQLYLFEEEFTWNGQDFYLFDTDGNEKIRISAPIPCKTFRLYDPENDVEIFKLTKRIFHIMPTYDLYESGQKIGRMKKRLIFHHKHFVADTSRGKLELRNMNATIGSNYQVRLDGKQIGTVARILNIELSNIVFDNFIISSAKPEYLPLMTAMGVMAAREAQRDKVDEVVSLVDD